MDIGALTLPLSPDAPCGPDLEADGDLDYLNLMARIEGDLPASFFSFDRSSLNVKAEAAALAGLLERTRDVRPIVFLAKLAILNRDLEAFADWLSALDALLSRHWASLHPAAADGQLALRSAVLQTLDDLPTVVLPLQYAPLITSRRVGAISFRSHMVAAGEVARRDGEPEIEAAAVEQAFDAAELDELIALRNLLGRIAGGVEALRRTWIAEAGLDDAPTLERLEKLSGRMLDFVASSVARRLPAGAPDAPEPIHDGPATSEVVAARAAQPIASARLAATALETVARYLSLAEPSNPALLLVLQAQRMVGRSFAEIAQIVMPDVFDDARITVGADQQFTFRLDRLPEVEAAPEPDDSQEGADGEPLAVRSRRDVQATLDQVAAFYRSAEPSNPIPLVCERARAMCNQDFLTLIRDMLPRRRD